MIASCNLNNLVAKLKLQGDQEAFINQFVCMYSSQLTNRSNQLKFPVIQLATCYSHDKHKVQPYTYGWINNNTYFGFGLHCQRFKVCKQDVGILILLYASHAVTNYIHTCTVMIGCNDHRYQHALVLVCVYYVLKSGQHYICIVWQFAKESGKYIDIYRHNYK